MNLELVFLTKSPSESIWIWIFQMDSELVFLTKSPSESIWIWIFQMNLELVFLTKSPSESIWIWIFQMDSELVFLTQGPSESEFLRLNQKIYLKKNIWIHLNVILPNVFGLHTLLHVKAFKYPKQNPGDVKRKNSRTNCKQLLLVSGTNWW